MCKLMLLHYYHVFHTCSLVLFITTQHNRSTFCFVQCVQLYYSNNNDNYTNNYYHTYYNSYNHTNY